MRMVRCMDYLGNKVMNEAKYKYIMLCKGFISLFGKWVKESLSFICAVIIKNATAN